MCNTNICDERLFEDKLKLYHLPGDPYWKFRTDDPCPTPELDCSDCQNCFNEGEAIIRPKGIKNGTNNN